MLDPNGKSELSFWMKRALARLRSMAEPVSSLSDGAKLISAGVIVFFVGALFVGGVALTRIVHLRNSGNGVQVASVTLPARSDPASVETKAQPKKAVAVTVQAPALAKHTPESQEQKKPENTKADAHAFPLESILSKQVVMSPPVTPQAPGEGETESSDIVKLRASWFFDQRAYPNKHIPEGALQKAIEQRDAMRNQQRAAFVPGSGASNIISFPGDALWHPMGPQPIDNSTFGVNGGAPTASGRVTAIAVDPSDATGNTAYIGGAAGGVWRTTDGGTTWMSLTDKQLSLAVGSIAIDPNNHNTIFVGTGEENFNGDAYYGAGILRSTDGGATWTQVGASTFARVLTPSTGGAFIGSIAVQPGNSNIVLAAVSFFVNGTIGGIYRSTDGGNTWTEDSSPVGLGATSVLFENVSNAGTTATAWAAMGNPFGESVNGIYKSSDSGLTWTKQAGAGLPTSNLGRITLGYAPSTSAGTTTIYAAIADSSTNSSNLLGIFITANGGGSWAKLTAAPNFCNSQCFYDIAVGVHPTNPSVVVVGGGAGPDNLTSLFESTNGGSSWTGTGTGSFTNGTAAVHPHVDTHSIVFTPSGTTLRLYVGNDGGVWRTDNPVPGAGVSPTWVDDNAELALTQFYPGPSAGISDENTAFGGTQDNDIEFFNNSLTWTNEFICGDGGFTAIDKRTPSTVYAGCNSTAGTKVKKAVYDGQFITGAGFGTIQGFDVTETAITASGDAMQFIPPLAIDEGNTENLYFGTCRVWMTNNAASSLANTFLPLTPTWNPISPDLSNGGTVTTSCPSTGGAGNITNLEVAHSNSSVIVAGTSNGKVWETTFGGPPWTQIDAGALPHRTVTAVRTKRNDSTGNIVYVTLSGFGACAGCGATPGHVFKSINAASGAPTWSNISGDLPDIPVNDIIVDHSGNPAHDALYIATDVGVFSCPDPEAASPCTNWTVVGDGLPNSPILGLTMRRSSRILHAATHGRSMFEIQLTDVNPPFLAALSSITPAAVNVVPGGAGNTALTVTGLNFSSNTQVQFDGSTTSVTTAFVNTTQLNVTLSNTLLQVGGVHFISLTDPAGVDSGSSILAGGGGPFAVMNPLVDPASMTPASAQTFTAVPFTFTSATSTEPFLPNTVLAFYDTSTPPVLQFTLPTVFDPAPTITGGGTTYKLTTAITDFTTPFTYQVVPYNPAPGGTIDPLSLNAPAFGLSGPVPFTFTVTANPGPLAIFNPNPIVLGPIAVGANTSITTFQISNPGSTNALNITAASLTPVSPPSPTQNFKFVPPTLAPSCNFDTTGVATVAAGASCFFGIQYSAGTPPGNANSTATLNVTDNAPGSPQAISVTGLVLSSAAVVVLTPVNFGAVAVGTTSPTMIATLFNGQSVPLNISSTGFTISAPGSNPGDFHLVSATIAPTPACPLPPTTLAIPANGSCDIGVSFTPSVAGIETATIKVVDDGPGSPQSAGLTGVGVQITSISPSIVATGGPAFTLTVNGGGFASSAVVNVNGSARLTTFVSATQLLASIPASDITTAGSLAISVTTPVPGGVQSEPKTLVVAQASVATNDDIQFATNITATPFRASQDTTQATTNTAGFTDPAPGAPCTSASTARSVWFAFKAPATGRVVADTRYSSYTTILSAWTTNPPTFSTFTAVACANGNIPASGPQVAESFIGFNVTSGTTYYIMVTDQRTGTAAVGGTLTFSLDFASAAPGNDDFNSATDASAAPFSNTVNSIEATTNTGGRVDPTPSCAPAGAASGGAANSVWYKYVATASGNVTADTLTSPYDTILTVVTGSPGSFTPVMCDDNATVSSTTVLQSQVSFAVSSGTTYFVMVSAVLGDGGTTNFHLTFSAGGVGVPTKLAFTVEPSNVTAAASIAPAVKVTVEDSNGNTVTTATNSISMTIGTNPGGGTLSGTNPVSATSGVATFSNLSINKAGMGYTLTASSSGLASATSTAFNVTAGAAATVAATSGSGQSATISTAFAAPLVATVTDSGGNPVSGLVVTFTPPASGASGTFTGGNTATTNASGVATSNTFTANSTAGGPYNVVASATGATSANFSLTNKAGAAAKVTATSGSGQSATISTAFAVPLVATVTDSGNNPVSGVVVTFTPPASGASGTFTGGNTATTNASGIATSNTFTANSTAGGPYNVVASATGATSANFSLTNKAGAAVKVTATSGTPQSTAINTAFAAPLVATVTDAGNNPVSGVVVTFTPPASGASGTFTGGNTATTNASGVATSNTFTANSTAGGPYNVVASATGATSANFSLTNTAGAAAKVTATSGTGQSATISTAFAAPLVATVTDAGNNPVSGVVVTFTPPASGASGTFTGGNTATTNASGVATSNTFTANSTAGGPYNVVASATGATSANFSLTNKAGAAAKVTATSGSGQSATISTAFAAPLVATVTDAGNNPVSGVVVTFTPPASGASGTFTGGNTATTNASGVATSNTFTANSTAGGPYNVVASATGATSANFSLTNKAGAAAKVAVTSGSGQSATISTAFAAPLVATVTDAGNNPVSGVVVTFTPPASGASGTFTGGNTATTNASGVATSNTFTANSTAGGPYNVVASATGATSANFSLTNTAGVAAKVTATSGSGQSAAINTAFAAPLVATVTDSANNPVSGVVVTFTPPASGASGTFTGGNTATTNASGVATSNAFTANGTAGGPYNVVASATGATSANFSLTNKAGAAAKVAVTSGSGQSATISTAFAAPLVATVTDAGNNPVSGVVVTFTPPASGASGTFTGGNTATTNASGVATSNTFTANSTAGGPYNVVASATGATSANFSLTNKAGAAATVAATSGSGQSAAINTAFAAPLVATVTDSGNNPVSGVVVTFTPPASGASGTFTGGGNTATTNASGVATSNTFTANGTAGGPYNVVASATGATSANFSLTNTAVPPGKVAVTSGSGQSATISTAFAAPFVATVTDNGGNPVNGAVVTFTPPASGASGTFAGGMNTATTNASGVATSAVFTANSTAGSYNVVGSSPNATSANFGLTNTAGPAAKVAATSGSGQSATISTAFAAPLVATVTDSGNNPVSGVVVTFTPPASGASGTFTGGNTATTNASGVATSNTFTANSTAGGPYNVVASATGATSANFSLTNTAGAAAKVTATSGTGQSATISTAFAAPLVATVTDSGGNPVSGVVVTFTPPASGASGTFTGGNTATTNASGIATSNTFTANSTAGGPYNVVASATGATSANFSLTNKAGAAAKVTATSGTPQSAAINTAFGAALVATVTDAGNNPVSGVVVTFTPPASGASGTFTGGNTATTNASGVATSNTFTANGTAGGPYNVVASATGATSANFSLTNLTGTPATVTATAGTPQSAAINTAFTTQLQATVKDAGSNPVSGVVVTFTPPASGASGTFAGGMNTATTNASGVATAPVFTANATVGIYNVNATVAGIAAPAAFALTNNAGPAASITATGGTPQNATINTAFAAKLQATVKDAGGNPVSGVTVTFAAPASGASGTFTGGNTATTNASGVAISATFTANSTAGSYMVTATVSGVANGANFALTNTPGPPASITATGGTPQLATVNTAFAMPFQATVKDAGGNAVNGALVTFTAPVAGASGSFAGGANTAMTNASGVATSAAFAANGTGGNYNVMATVVGVAAPANFALTNNNAQPVASSLSPPSVLAGSGGFVLTINGSNFVVGAKVDFGSDKGLTPTSVTAAQIKVNIPAADVATAGTPNVIVNNPAPAVGPSTAIAFTVNNPVPTITGVNSAGQNHVPGGAAFTLTVNGTNFVSTSVINFGVGTIGVSKPEPTTFVSATQLTAAIPASEVAAAGPANVTVTNAAPGGGTTAANTSFTIDGYALTGPSPAPTVVAGKSVPIIITLTPTANGFANAVNFTLTGLPLHSTGQFSSTTLTPGSKTVTTTLTVMTTGSSAMPPAAPVDPPTTPLLRLLPLLWLAALLAGIFALQTTRRVPRLRRYAAIVPLVLLLVTGAVLAGCSGYMNGTPKGPAQLTITGTSGSFVQNVNVTLTVQ